MSKAMLVMDMPSNCQECPCMYGGICFAKNKVGNPDDIDAVMTIEESYKGRPEWCPFTELPKKMEVCGTYPQPGPVPSYKVGWNACIDKIMGQENDDKTYFYDQPRQPTKAGGQGNAKI